MTVVVCGGVVTVVVCVAGGALLSFLRKQGKQQTDKEAADTDVCGRRQWNGLPGG